MATAAVVALAAGGCGGGDSVTRYRATYRFANEVGDLRSAVAEINYGEGIGPYANATGEPVNCRPIGNDLLVAVDDEGLGMATLHLLALGSPCAGCEGTDDGDGTLVAGNTFHANEPLFECDFELQGAVRVQNFAARTLTADDSAGQALSPLPDFAVDFTPIGGAGPVASNGIFDVRFTVVQPALLSALQFDAVFSGDGDWRDGDRCSFKVPAALATCNAKGNGVLTCGLVSPSGIETPREIVACEIESSQAEISPEEITTIVVDASDPATLPIDVDAHATAYPDDGGPQPPSADDPVYDVTFTLASDVGSIGALQFEAEFMAERGGWVGARTAVDCRFLAPVDVAACNDKSGGALVCAFASVAGIDTPSDIVRCAVASGTEPVAADFDVRTVDASTPEFGRLSAVVSVGAIEERSSGPEPSLGSNDRD